MNKELNKPIYSDNIYGTIKPTSISETLITAVPVINPVSDVVLYEYSPELTKQIFISKVYTILWFQIFFTSIFIGVAHQVPVIQQFLLSNVGSMISLINMFLLLISTCVFFSSENMIKNHSFKFLCFYTILITYIVGYVGIIYSPTTLLLSGVSTLTIFSGLTLYAFQTKYDYTQHTSILISSLLGLLCFGFFMSFVHIPYLSIVYSSLGAILFSFYIIYDTQLIVGGKHRTIKFRESDYNVAAISLYTDILNLFLFILQIIGGSHQ